MPPATRHPTWVARAGKNLPGNPSWEWPSNFTDSVLWNGKVVPLLRNTIKGAVWMQGEKNAKYNDGRQYNCSFPAMIEDWRAKWAEGTGGTTEATFPFGWSQLNSDGAATAWSPTGTTPNVPSNDTDPDPLMQWTGGGFPPIRNAESNTLSVANTFQAVIIDTPVASGSVHSPYKQPAGARLARQALATAYGIPQPSPVAVSASKTASSIVITLGNTGDGGTLVHKSLFGFEVLGNDGKWHVAPVIPPSSPTLPPLTVTVGPIPAGASAVRYLWTTAPCGNAAPFQCAVYVTAPTLGALSGELDLLPLGPFLFPL